MTQSGRADNSSYLMISATILALGIMIGGYLLGDGLKRARLADRTVTVRGLAERNVEANLATWKIQSLSTGRALAAVQDDAKRDAAAIREFLSGFGFGNADIQAAGVNVNQWDGNKGPNIQVRQTLRLKTGDIAAAARAHAAQARLLDAGVALEGGEHSMTYSFTRLNDIKPEMIAEATKNARASAEQFAKDSGARVGGIRSATQGYFSIQAHDGDDGSASRFPGQKVRVVTTVNFYLTD